jgi:hypothetical protein
MQRYILHVCMLWAGEDAMLWSPAGKKNHWAPVIAQDVCMCMGSRSQRFFGNFDFFGWLRQPAGRMAQVSSVAGAVYIYIRFQSRDQIELCQEHGAWFGNIIGKIGSVWISNIQHSSWFVGSLHRLCTFFGTHSHVHCKFWTSLVKIGSSNAFGYPTFELVCWFFTSFMYIFWHA